MNSYTLLLLAILHLFTYRSPVQADRDAAGELVRMVYEAGGIDAVALVSMESNFNPRAERRESGGTSYGLFQLYDRYHDQHRGDIAAHIAEGARFLEECKWGGGAVPNQVKADAVSGGRSSVRSETLAAPSFAWTIAIYNGGTHPGRQAREWGKRVETRRDSLALYVYRHLR